MTRTQLPKVVLIGRTNAGKSTLFNKLTNSQLAMVSPLENTTRDQNRARVYWKGQMFELIDTGGLDTAALDPLNQAIQEQVQRAVHKADAIIFIVDGKQELMPQDKAIISLQYQFKKPIILCVNKIDSQRLTNTATATFSSLPFPMILCSAKNGFGTNILLDTVLQNIPTCLVPDDENTKSTIKLAIIGRPNVGKSSLFNAFINEPLAIVSDLPHTTRDINQTTFNFGEQVFTIVDTAGIRKKSRVGEWRATADNNFTRSQAKLLGKVEQQSIVESLASIDKADIVLLMLEAQLSVSGQDKTLVDYAKRHGKSLIILINKWDLIPDKTAATIYTYQKYFSKHLSFAKNTPLLFVSALKKQRLNTILHTALHSYRQRFYRLPQNELDSVLRSIQKHEPKQKKALMKGQTKKPLTLISLNQIAVDPPTFRLVTKNPKNVAPAIIDLLEKGIRRRCDYDGIPVIINVRNS